MGFLDDLKKLRDTVESMRDGVNISELKATIESTREVLKQLDTALEKVHAVLELVD